jgi:hypothetical protein
VLKLISQQTDKISQQPENLENRNGPDLVQAFPKKWWVESDITAPNLPLPLRLKGSISTFSSQKSKLTNKRYRKPKGKSIKNNSETCATLGTRH